MLIMKRSDKEILEFINNKGVLTHNELKLFIYGELWGSRRTRYWWNYVIQNKNWKKLKIYSLSKQNHNSKQDLFHKIYIKDKRFREVGHRKVRNMLKNIYNINLSPTTIKKYLKNERQNTKDGAIF